jgi:NAD(P)-dependent dehydrogenase (short-subunit alcohol dehydrogenase family)
MCGESEHAPGHKYSFIGSAPKASGHVAGWIGTALSGNAFYAATKAEVAILTKRFAMEPGPYNITVNAVALGFVRADMTQRGRSADNWQDTEEAFAAKAMMGRIGEPEDIANALALDWLHLRQAGSPHRCWLWMADAWTTLDKLRDEPSDKLPAIRAGMRLGRMGLRAVWVICPRM